ncbi:hypothetical protein [Rahnella perminowiae]|uniref:hypothetical protein n=1 Tax=Rahnella perminowiae TaxID=2816244 RepID=UPI001C273C8A|nr:hypothetical protein [Rahnella perminowiae]MBU9828258.1 hypothetical protein [Rahnella perminowiae]
MDLFKICSVALKARPRKFRFFNYGYHMRFRAETDQREKCFFPLGSPFAFNSPLSLAGYVSATTATGWKSCRYAVPSLGPEAFGLQAAPFSKISESPAAF